MALKKSKPVTPSLRFHVGVDYSEITRSKPEKSLVSGRRRVSGRSGSGRISVRHRGGGHKRRYRQIDFKRDKFDVPAKVASIEYDPNRSAHIALLHYLDGEKRYILAARGLTVGDRVISSREPVAIAAGNASTLNNIPLGRTVHNVELYPGRGGQMVRSAGAGAVLTARDKGYVSLKMPSGEIRRVLEGCLATIGSLTNEDWMNVSLGKAGRRRWYGKRPTVRGVAMNPVDHPHGGGEGKTSGGRHPVSPQGKGTKGLKTRKKNNPTDKFIVKRRVVKKKRR